MRCSVTAAIAAIALGVFARPLRADSFPMMDPDKPVRCVRDKDGKVWRIQCNEATKVCLYTANEELDSSGARSKPLERARDCAVDEHFDRAKLEASGYTMVQGRPDAPWGWTRDERGRVFQVNFDLRKRLYFGAGYTPRKILENPLESKRTSIDFGLLQFESVADGDNPVRHRVRLVQGEVHLEPFAAEVVVAHYDLSRHFANPLLRLTTFAGTPRRHDLYLNLGLNLGLWSEAGGLEVHRASGGYSTLWRHATAMVTLDLWQSHRLDSYLRLRTGLGLEGQHDEVNGYRHAIAGASALDLDIVLDEAGFHNVQLELSHEVPRYFVPVPDTSSKFSQRFRARVQYEAIVLAINDQPLTLKLAASGEKRDDIPGVPNQWAFVMDAGLRFSLWAPPRPRS
jgi:hypothetical protein